MVLIDLSTEVEIISEHVSIFSANVRENLEDADPNESRIADLCTFYEQTLPELISLYKS